MTLNLFPVRVPIGRVFNSDGSQTDVLMTPEFARAMNDLLVRVGGPSSMSLTDVSNLIASESTSSAAVSDLSRKMNDLSVRQNSEQNMSARIAVLERRIEDLNRILAIANQSPVDWEHPGKIGAGTANTGKFTNFEAIGTVNIHPDSKSVDIKPVGTSLLTIQPAQTGQIDNMELGKTVPCPARVQTLNKVTVTQPASGATLTLSDGAALTVPSPGGTLGSAAYQPATAFASRTTSVLAPVATDPASTQTLANSIRTVLLSVGIGS